MTTFRHSTVAIREYEQSIKKDGSTLMQIDANNCVVKAIAIAFQLDYQDAYNFCKEYFGREHGNGVRTIDILKNIESLAYDSGKKVVGYWHHRMFGEYGKERNEFYTAKFTNIPDIAHNFNRRKYLTIEQVRYQSKGRSFFVLIKGHALTIKDGIVYDYKESKKQRVFHVIEIK